MAWQKQSVNAKEFGWRREDDLAYVGKSASGWWRVYVRTSVGDDFKLLSSGGWDGDRIAMHDADAWLDRKAVAA